MNDYPLKVDEKMEAILASIEEREGWVTTSQVKIDTGLSTNPIRYRFEKLDEDGLAEMRTSSQNTGAPIPPKELLLNDEGVELMRSVVEGGVEDERPGESRSVEVTREQFESMQESIERLETQFTAAMCPADGGHPIRLHEINERVENLKSEVEDRELQDRLEFLHGEVEKLQARSLAYERVLDRFSGCDIEDEIDRALAQVRRN